MNWSFCLICSTIFSIILSTLSVNISLIKLANYFFSLLMSLIYLWVSFLTYDFTSGIIMLNLIADSWIALIFLDLNFSIWNRIFFSSWFLNKSMLSWVIFSGFTSSTLSILSTLFSWDSLSSRFLVLDLVSTLVWFLLILILIDSWIYSLLKMSMVKTSL